MAFNWEAVAGFLGGFITLAIVFLAGVWRISSQIRGLEDGLKPIPELIQAKNDHEKRLTKIETVCKMNHPGRGRSTAIEAMESP